MSQRPALSKTEIHEFNIFKRCDVFISEPLNIYPENKRMLSYSNQASEL